MKLSRDFFERDTLTVAKELIGCELVFESPSGVVSGIIVETEAYLHDDPASHSYAGKTARNAHMFESAGVSYVYFSYGNHYCFNVVTAKKDVGEAVLIRALEPKLGVDLMKKRRGVSELLQLCSGPGKLTQAFGIQAAHSGWDLCNGSLYLLNKHDILPIACTKRIGITKAEDKLYRFILKNSVFLSRKAIA